jgi:hypothetical protein
VRGCESTVSSHATAHHRAHITHAPPQSTTIYPATTGSGSDGCGGPVGEGSSLRFFPLATLEVGAGGAQAMGSGRAAGLGVALAPCVLACGRQLGPRGLLLATERLPAARVEQRQPRL